MSREDLQKKTCKELMVIAKELNISGRWDMTKVALIEAILGAKVFEENEEVTSAKDEVKIDNQECAEAEVKNENNPANTEIDMKQKMPYIENVEIGTLVAFRLSNGRVKTAKVVRKSTKNRKLKLETNYGAVYIVSYEDIVWVRTGKRWPRGVYKLLKGAVETNVETKA